MKMKWGALVVDGRGKIGGHVASKNRSGSYLRTKVTPVNPQTVSQQGVRNKFTLNSQAWRGLSQLLRDAWNSAVEDFKSTDIFGDLKSPSGFNLFMRLNNQLLAVFQPVITAPPLPGSIFAFTSLSVTADTTGGTMNAVFAPAIPVGSSVIVLATPGLSPGKNFVKSEFRQIAVLVTGDLTPEDLASAYIAKFGALPTVGKKVFIGFKVVNDLTGQAGTVLQASSIAI